MTSRCSPKARCWYFAGCKASAVAFRSVELNVSKGDWASGTGEILILQSLVCNMPEIEWAENIVGVDAWRVDLECARAPLVWKPDFWYLLKVATEKEMRSSKPLTDHVAAAGRFEAELVGGLTEQMKDFATRKVVLICARPLHFLDYSRKI